MDGCMGMVQERKIKGRGAAIAGWVATAHDPIGAGVHGMDTFGRPTGADRSGLGDRVFFLCYFTLGFSEDGVWGLH